MCAAKKHRMQLNELLNLNEGINTVRIFKEPLKHIGSHQSRIWAGKALNEGCALARALSHRAVNPFAKILKRHRYGILNHCDYPIHSGEPEGVNNKIKVIKRKAYGFHDLRYFTLKIPQACYNAFGEKRYDFISLLSAVRRQNRGWWWVMCVGPRHLLSSAHSDRTIRIEAESLSSGQRRLNHLRRQPTAYSGYQAIRRVCDLVFPGDRHAQPGAQLGASRS